jgi:acetyl-CoA carboxylase biotin carboxylase subunit
MVMTFIGPKAETIRLMGDKITAKQAAVRAGIPVVPGSDGAISDMKEARKVAKEIGFPVLIKAASGGGGRGMKVAETKRTWRTALQTASSEAAAAFGDGAVYIEKYLGSRAISKSR